jgi:small subunit ribosomal protein S1
MAIKKIKRNAASHFSSKTLDRANLEANEKALYSQLDTFISDAGHQVRKLTAGDIVEGTIVDTMPGALVVDVGYKAEGIVSDKELKSDTFDADTAKIGDTLLVYVVKPENDEGGLVLSVRRTESVSQWMTLEKSMNENSVIEATVVEANNGGVICDLGGGIRGFIPTSQLDATRVYLNGVRTVGKDISKTVQKRLSSLIGEKIKTRIAELNREKSKIILSEKMFLQERDLGAREDTLRKVNEGDVLKGEVSGITNYGVFVNAQGLEGLVHLSELSWDKVEKIEEMFQVGTKVDVMVIGIYDGGKRIAYSVKRLQQDPWSAAISKFKVGDVVDGLVQKVVDYGAFIRIGNGLNGLVHISEMSDKLVHNPRDIVNEGDSVKVRILSISTTERHLGLSLKAANNTFKTKKSDEEGAESAEVSAEESVASEKPKAKKSKVVETAEVETKSAPVVEESTPVEEVKVSAESLDDALKAELSSNK